MFYSVTNVGGGLRNIPLKAGDFVYWVDIRETYFCIADGIAGAAILVNIRDLLFTFGIVNKDGVAPGVYNMQKNADGTIQFVAVQPGGGFVFQQNTPAATWVVVHGLNRHPAVVIEDSTNRRVEGSIVYNSPSQLTISFSAPFAGTATCV